MAAREEIDFHTNQWVLKLERASGEEGYFVAVGDDGIKVTPSIDGRAQRFESRKAVDKLVKRLVKDFGLDLEEATPENLVHEKTDALWLSEGESANGMSIEVDEKTGKRFMLVRHDGMENSFEMEDEAADTVVRIIQELRGMLRNQKQ